MVLLEIASLILSGVGLIDYYYTVKYENGLRELKRKYGEHPNIDDAFKDICTLGGEYFKMPELVLDNKNPHIDMGKFYPYETRGPRLVLNEFFVTSDEIKYFKRKYEKEVERQRELRHIKLYKIYNEIYPLYKNGELATMGSKRIRSRRFESPLMFALSAENYKTLLQEMCNNTVWGELIEAGPNICGGNYEYMSEWYLKEDAIQKVRTEEVLELLFKSCYFHNKCNSR